MGKINENDIALEILNESYEQYENEKYNIIRVATKLDDYSGHMDVALGNETQSHILNNRKAKAKLRRIADEEYRILQKELKIKVEDK